jgi:hypothetical protein
MTLRFLLWAAFVLAAGVSSSAADTKQADDEPIALGPFVVTASTRGIIPLTGYFRFHRLSGNVKSAVIIVAPMDVSKSLEEFGAKPGEQIIAVAGQRIIGMDRAALIRIWMEDGEAGDPVKLTVQGTGEDATVYRQLLLKRIAPPRPAKERD